MLYPSDLLVRRGKPTCSKAAIGCSEKPMSGRDKRRKLLERVLNQRRSRVQRAQEAEKRVGCRPFLGPLMLRRLCRASVIDRNPPSLQPVVTGIQNLASLRVFSRDTEDVVEHFFVFLSFFHHTTPFLSVVQRVRPNTSPFFATRGEISKKSRPI